MIKGVNHVTLVASDLETSFNFYKDILGCQPLARWQRGAYFLVGDLWLCHRYMGDWRSRLAAVRVDP